MAPSADQLDAWLRNSEASLRAESRPAEQLVGTLTLGLLRDGRPVGCEVFATTIVTVAGQKVYRFADRAVLQQSDGTTVRIDSSGLSDASFSGLTASLTMTASGQAPLPARTVTADRIGPNVRIVTSDRPDDAPLRLRAEDKRLALSGELERLVRLRKWQPGETLALWHLDAVNGEISPVVMRAMNNDLADLAGRKLGPVKVETWFAHVDTQAGLSLHLSRATYFDPAGAVTLVVKPDGLTKVVLTETEFKRDWEARFESAD